MMSNMLIDQLRGRIEDTRRQLEEARQAEAKAKALAETLAADLGGYNLVLQAELRRSGQQVAQEEAAAMNAQDKVEAAAIREELEHPLNKTQFLVNFVSSRNGTGVTPAEINAEFARANISIPRNYVYSMIQRLLAKNRIKRKRGKYFPGEPGVSNQDR